MTDQAELPNRSQNMSADQFREKFRLLNPNVRSRAEVNFIAGLAKSIGGPESCQNLLSAIGRQIQGAADEPDETIPRLTQGETAKGPKGEMAIEFRAQGQRNPRNPLVGTCYRPDIVPYEEKRLIVSQDQVPISARTRFNKLARTT